MEKSELSSGIWQFAPISLAYILKDFLVFLEPVPEWLN